jgi:hypothetical protein
MSQNSRIFFKNIFWGIFLFFSVQNSRNQGFSYYFGLMIDPDPEKNLRIRIRQNAYRYMSVLKPRGRATGAAGPAAAPARRPHRH